MRRLLAFLMLPCVVLLSACQKAEEETDAQAEPQVEREGVIGKVTAEVVDMKKALAENPDLVVFQRNGLGNDPLTQYANAYIYLSSEIQMQNMKHQMDILKAMNERYPTYEEFMQFVKQYGFQFSKLKPWQKYGYNEETGSMVILQDEAEKKRRLEKAGVEYKEGTL